MADRSSIGNVLVDIQGSNEAVKTIAFQYKLSDLVEMWISEEGGVKIIELEFKFARYRLFLDDEAKTKAFMELLMGKIIWPEKEVKEKPKVKMPHFYAKQPREVGK